MFKCPRTKVINTTDRFGTSASIPVPCGKCEFCLKKTREEWVSRISAELEFHGSALFATLTYDDAHLPDSDFYNDRSRKLNGTLRKSDYQRYIKRVRRHIEYHYPLYAHKLRYVLVGEYGEKTGRAHYHALFFGVPPFLLQHILKSLWIYGSVNKFDIIYSDGKNPLNFMPTRKASVKPIRYLLKYLTKGKVSGVNGDTRVPEFISCSKRPMIGDRFALTFGDMVRSDRQFFLPSVPLSKLKYLDEQLKSNPDLLSDLDDYTGLLPDDTFVYDPFRYTDDIGSPQHNIYIRFGGRIYKTPILSHYFSRNGSLSLGRCFYMFDPLSRYDGTALRFTPHMRTKVFEAAFPELLPFFDDFEERYPSEVDLDDTYRNFNAPSSVRLTLSDYSSSIMPFYKQWHLSSDHYKTDAALSLLEHKHKVGVGFDRV